MVCRVRTLSSDKNERELCKTSPTWYPHTSVMLYIRPPPPPLCFLERTNIDQKNETLMNIVAYHLCMSHDHHSFGTLGNSFNPGLGPVVS